MTTITHADASQAESLAKLQKMKACALLNFKAGLGERETKRKELEDELRAQRFVYAIDEKRGAFGSEFCARIWFKRRKDAYRIQDIVTRFSPLGHAGRTIERHESDSWIAAQRRA